MIILITCSAIVGLSVLLGSMLRSAASDCPTPIELQRMHAGDVPRTVTIGAARYSAPVITYAPTVSKSRRTGADRRKQAPPATTTTIAHT